MKQFKFFFSLNFKLKYFVDLKEDYHDISVQISWQSDSKYKKTFEQPTYILQTKIKFLFCNTMNWMYLLSSPGSKWRDNNSNDIPV